MANDRVMLRCTVCGGRFALLRYFPLGDPRDFLKPSWVIDDVKAWLEKHCSECHRSIHTRDLEGDPRFVTETE